VTSSPQRFAWVLNLDAEFELAKPGYQPKQRLLTQLAEHGAASRRLLGPNDVLVGEGELGSTTDFVGRAWCPTPSALATLAARGITPEPHPDAAVLRRVNHRRFAHELGGGLPEQACVATRTELEPILRQAQHPWLLKRPLAFAGRGQQRVFEYSAITEKEWSWIDASLAADVLIVEPLVKPSLELSVHGFISASAKIELGRVCVQEVSERGVFRAVRLAAASELSAEETRLLYERGERVAAALIQAGYFGPFGVDAYRYLAGARTGFCELGEINARYTLGFLTGFPRHPSELRVAP
jgi:hypothetical protein